MQFLLECITNHSEVHLSPTTGRLPSKKTLPEALVDQSALLAQLVERTTEDREVAGSNPAEGNLLLQ